MTFTNWLEDLLGEELETPTQRLIKKIKIPSEFMTSDGRLRPRVWSDKYQCHLVDKRGGWK